MKKNVKSIIFVHEVIYVFYGTILLLYNIISHVMRMKKELNKTLFLNLLLFFCT